MFGVKSNHTPRTLLHHCPLTHPGGDWKNKLNWKTCETMNDKELDKWPKCVEKS